MTNNKNFKLIDRSKISNLPGTAGVYCFKNEKNVILYIGKAGNIRSRVKNHFSQPNHKNPSLPLGKLVPFRNRDDLFINQVVKIGYMKTDSEIEALILESQLIKKQQPKYNVLWKDDKNYFYVAITKEEFPRIFITHQPKSILVDKKLQDKYIGPFVEGKSLKRTLDFLRKVFPYYVGIKHPKGYCLWCNLKLCPGPDPDKKQYKKNINNLAAVLQGKRAFVLKNLKQEMRYFSKTRDYEKAGRKRDQATMLEKIIFHSRVLEPQLEPLAQRHNHFPGRMEAYDISNIQGHEATGSMIVFNDGKTNKDQYRKFKIQMANLPNDTAMIKEVLSRRLKHKEWPYPSFILIDGGKAQLNAALSAINKVSDAKNIKVMALAKRNNELFQKNENKPILLKNMPNDFSNVILRARDEAHRFAIAYHKKLRHKALITN